MPYVSISKRAKPDRPFMQHYKVPSAEYSSYINHVISLELAEDYTAHLRASCSPKQSPPSELPLIKPADICLDWWMIYSQCRPLALVCLVGQQNGAPVPDAAIGLAAVVPNTLRMKLISSDVTSSSMPVVQLSHRTQSRLSSS